MMSPWFFTPNNVLIRLYHQVVEQDLNDELRQIIYDEIKRRNLRLNKPTYLKRIK
ncbi:sporulation histidine kinase inhibitor Sda [Priestia filamentosa]|uniref:sporulation histidine kinase inhibitor Sda n=1 Tax=Priestia filamentosa TaxID=1402861 RepID=UPI00397DA983